MRFVRIVESLALALAVLAVILFLLVAGLSSAVSLSWECHGPADDAADEDWAWINGQPVHYQDAGSKAAPTVVLVHGHYVEGMEAWRETLKDLPRSGLRVVAMDSVGYGRSVRDPEADYTLAGQARVLAELLNELRVMDATVVGHDWGCAVALQLAQDQPQFVERLVLVAPVGEHPAAGFSRCARVPLVGRGIVWAMDANGPLWSARRRAEFADPGVADAYLDRLAFYSRIEGTADCLVSAASLGAGQDPFALLAETDLPVLVICGAEDPLLTDAGVERLSMTLSDSEVAIIEGVGHYPQVERASEVDRLIAAFSLGQ